MKAEQKSEKEKMSIFDDEIHIFKKKIEDNPTFYMHHYRLGAALEKVGQIDGAIAAYRRSIELNNKSSFSYDSLGQILTLKGQLDEAIEMHRTAIKLNPCFHRFHYNLAQVLLKKDCPDEALLELQAGLKKKTKNHPSYYELIGDILADQGKKSEAITYYEKILMLDDNIGSSDQILQKVYDLKKSFNNNRINLDKNFFYHLKLNSYFWNHKQLSLKNQWIIVDAVVPSQDRFLISYTIRHLIAAKCLQKLYGYKIMAWINTKHYELKKVLSSFGVEKFIYHTNNDVELTRKQKYQLEEFERLATPENFKSLMLNFTSKNLHIGDLIYDSLLKQKCLSTPTFDEQVFNYLENGCVQINYWEKILESYDVKAVILGHTVQFRGILARLAATKGITIFGMQSGWLLRQYNTLDELYDFPTFISQEIFEYFWKNHKDKALHIGKELLKNQIGIKQQASNQTSGDSVIYPSLAYTKDKKVYNREQICSQLNLDSSLPIVIVASHTFNDVPHCHRHRIFLDYYDWLVETLKICSQIGSINWIVKEHPNVGMKKHNYHVEKTAKKLVTNEYNLYQNIKLAPDDMSNISLLDFCHAIVTVSSTMSHEMACFGIPSILAGSSNISSCGFTHNAKDFEEYKAMLYSIKNLGRLKSEEIEKAYIAYAILFHFTRVKSNFNLGGDLCSAMKYMIENRMVRHKNIEEDYFFRNFTIQLMLKNKLSLRYDEIVDI